MKLTSTLALSIDFCSHLFFLCNAYHHQPYVYYSIICLFCNYTSTESKFLLSDISDISYTVCCAQLLKHVPLFVTPWTVALQDPLFIGLFKARILGQVGISCSMGSICLVFFVFLEGQLEDCKCSMNIC